MIDMKNYIQWKELEKNLKDKRTIVFQTQKMYANEKKYIHIYWSLGTLIEVVKFFGSQNLVFQ